MTPTYGEFPGLLGTKIGRIHGFAGFAEQIEVLLPRVLNCSFKVFAGLLANEDTLNYPAMPARSSGKRVTVFAAQVNRPGF